MAVGARRSNVVRVKKSVQVRQKQTSKHENRRLAKDRNNQLPPPDPKRSTARSEKVEILPRLIRLKKASPEAVD